nr:osteocrin isoform X1 [Cavia porcellus]
MPEMLDWRRPRALIILAVTLMLWSSEVLSVDVTTKASDSGVIDAQLPPTVREEKSATDLATKLLLLDELVSLENDVIETKKKRSFSGFGSPIDRLSAGSGDHKSKQRKAVNHPKRRFGIPVDRIGRNRLSNSRG